MRYIITGGPRTGKTTLANEMAEVNSITYNLHTDELMHMEWSAVSDYVAKKMLEYAGGNWIFEGVRMTHALRKFMAHNPGCKPCDTIVRLTEPRVNLTPKQASLAKAEKTIWNEIQSDLLKLNVSILGRPWVDDFGMHHQSELEISR